MIFKKLTIAGSLLLGFVAALTVWHIYIPLSLALDEKVLYDIKRGTSGVQIARDLKSHGVIKSSFVFNAYVVASGSKKNLQAGFYEFSSAMSVAEIVNKLTRGDVIKNEITIVEGWTLAAIGQYLEDKNIFSKSDFLNSVAKDFSLEFDFLKDKPSSASLEGYLFPDTYYITAEVSSDDFVRIMLRNFGRKMTPETRKKIADSKKSIFQIVTMASILEKEVRTLEDKKIVAGILWKRLDSGMPLQVDATVNYATGKSDARALIKDTQIDSPYNTYKYLGLPAGPISNPGLESIVAALYPTESEYWFYLSAKANGQTIFSKTFKDHVLATEKYLNS